MRAAAIALLDAIGGALDDGFDDMSVRALLTLHSQLTLCRDAVDDALSYLSSPVEDLPMP